MHRLFAVVSPEDWKRIADAAAGLAATTHVIFIRAGEEMPTAVRELLYTIPEQLWDRRSAAVTNITSPRSIGRTAFTSPIVRNGQPYGAATGVLCRRRQEGLGHAVRGTSTCFVTRRRRPPDRLSFTAC